MLTLREGALTARAEGLLLAGRPSARIASARQIGITVFPAASGSCPDNLALLIPDLLEGPGPAVSPVHGLRRTAPLAGQLNRHIPPQTAPGRLCA